MSPPSQLQRSQPASGSTPRRSARLAERTSPPLNHHAASATSAVAAGDSATNSAVARPSNSARGKRRAKPSVAAAAKRTRHQKEEEEEETHSCCICMSPIGRRDLSKINCCDHHFCFGCIAEWSKTQNQCPLCKERFQKISRVHPVRTCRTARAGDTNHNNRNELECEERNELRPVRRPMLSLTEAMNGNEHAYAIASQIFQEIAPMIMGVAGPTPRPDSLARLFSARLSTALGDRSSNNNNRNRPAPSSSNPRTEG